MKYYPIILLFALFTGPLFSQNEFVTNVEVITIYHSGALVERSGSKNLKNGLNEIMIKNVSSKMVMNSLKIRNPEITVLNKTLIRKLSTEEYSQLLDQKEALTNEQTLIEAKFKEEGFVSNVEDLEKLTLFYSTRIVQIKKELREIELQIEEAGKLDEYHLENENAAILKLSVSVDGPLKENFGLRYVCGGIGWSPAYDVIVKSSNDKELELKYMAKVMSQTGENWENVSIRLSSSFPLESPTDLPTPGSAWVLNESGGSFNAGNNYGKNYEQDQEQMQAIDKLEGVEYREIRIPSFLKTRTLSEKYSIKSNSTVFTFPIINVSLPTHFYYFAFPSLDPEVYLVAEVTQWDTLGLIDGIADISFEGNDVGKSVIAFSESRDTLLLPVGKDNSVYLKRSEIADQKYFKEKNDW